MNNNLEAQIIKIIENSRSKELLFDIIEDIATREGTERDNGYDKVWDFYFECARKRDAVDNSTENIIDLRANRNNEETNNSPPILPENENEQSDRLLLEELDHLLANLPLESQDRIRGFVSFEIQKTRKTSSEMTLPSQAPELWKRGQGEDSLAFLQRVYKPQIKDRTLTYQWLREHDKPLYNAIRQAVKRNQNIDSMQLPVTESEIVDQEYNFFVRLLGETALERISSLVGTMKQRMKRNSKEQEKQPYIS